MKFSCDCKKAKKKFIEFFNPFFSVSNRVEQKNTKTMVDENHVDAKCDTKITVTSAEVNVKNSLIVVSNRLPFVLKKAADGTMHRQAR